eukprot:m.22252 g.22252  ORF g.22252 m.22252 type:complete len:69 (-) comp8370_c0_seq2:1915-2121(-)
MPHPTKQQQTVSVYPQTYKASTISHRYFSRINLNKLSILPDEDTTILGHRDQVIMRPDERCNCIAVSR